ncbi:leucine-rich repeat-containing protein 15-like [Hydractinia symbiolongicarpus]|uniref:leucine-rich repeat-containing protein 15-like n=1 Tax=Hydractinia symbiolongicarpus TaxID=13093 RepID=UPI00254A03EC|nr:leucine-rich repeat-containing protein 15-like [Hydractinia symbiolongicarpus]
MEEDAFVDLVSLNTFDLSKNQLKVLHSTIFTNFSKIKTLDLSKNMLNKVSTEIFNNTREFINELTPGVFNRLNRLTYLNFRNNYIKRFNGDEFAGLSQITSLDSANNLLDTLPEGLFDNTINLNYLDLGGNKFKVISNFSKLSKLLKLDLKLNQILGISPAAFKEMKVLKYLDLSQNRLKHVGNLLLENKNLEKLYLAGNELEDISLKETKKKLLEILFRGSRLYHISQDLFPNTLKVLDLFENFITSVSVNTFDNMVGLNKILLANNSIKSLDPHSP